jgi:hypothetical protein
MSAASDAMHSTHRFSMAAIAAFAHSLVLSMFASSSALHRMGANVKPGQFGYPNGTFPYNEGS